MADGDTTVPRQRIGNYEILDEIGHGGMGIIYRAHDTGLDRVVALKVLREDLRTQHQLVARFRREAQAAARLNHPNIVQIFAVGTENDIPFIAMQYVEGRPLSAIMQQRGPLHWRYALDISEQVALALSCAHDAAVIHRDIKPPNILIDSQDQAYVTDFGIAKILTVEEQLTVDGSRLGTPQYMSPERCRDGDVTASSDIYSLGVLMFQMISGRLPFEAASSVELVRKILSSPPARLRSFVPETPENIERLVAYLIEKKPENRPRDAEHVCEVIDLVRAGRSLDEIRQSMSSALSDFRKTDTPRPAYRDESTRIIPKGKVARFTLHWFGTPHPWQVMLAAVFLVLAGIGIGILVDRTTREDLLLAAARRIDADQGAWSRPPDFARIGQESAGVMLARLDLPHFRTVSATWQGNTLFTLLEGIPDSVRAGQRMVCSVQPDAASAAVVIAPLPGHAGQPAITLMTSTWTSLPDSPFGNGTLVMMRGSAINGSAYPAALIQFQARADATTPGVLIASPSAGVQVDATAPSLDNVARMAARPDGTALAIAYINPRDGTSDLLEVRPREDGSWSHHLLADFGPPIDDVVYARDGSLLAYTRRSGGGPDTLYLLPLDGNTRNGVRVTEDTMDMQTGAIHPDNNALAYTRLLAGGQTEIATVPLAEGAQSRSLCPGTHPSWTPDGSRVIAAALDRRGRFQISSVDGASGTLRQLTHLDAGTKPYCVLSASGKWAASFLDDAEMPVVVLARIE